MTKYRLTTLLMLLLTAAALAVPMPAEVVESPAQNVSPGDKIKVYWRWRDSKTEATDSKGYFDARNTLTAGDGGGFLSGKAVHKMLGDFLKYPPAEVWALDVKVGAKANETAPSIQVSDDGQEFYDNYTCRDKKGVVYLFLDLVQQ